MRGRKFYRCFEINQVGSKLSTSSICKIWSINYKFIKKSFKNEQDD